MADFSDEGMDNEARIHQNQPYDESLEVPDAEEIATPAGLAMLKKSTLPRVKPVKKASNSKPADEGGAGDSPPGDGALTDNSEEDFTTGGMNPKPTVPRPQPGLQKVQGQYNSEEEEEDGSDSSEDDEDDDDDEHVQVEGAYDPADYENLPVTPEIKELFQYITRYTAQSIELEYKLKPFIPDFIPAVGDIDAFIKIKRPDGKPDTLGLTVLDEPCAKQSDPTVLDLQLRAISKQTTAKTLVVKSLEDAEKNPKQIENWIESIRDLHRSKPPPNVHYSKNMPDIETLMQEWPADFEELLKEVGLPTAELDCDLGQYVEIISAILDIPVYRGSQQRNEKIQALHVLFTLYSEFKNSQHFRALAEENRLDNTLKKGGPGFGPDAGAGGGDDDHLVL